LVGQSKESYNFLRKHLIQTLNGWRNTPALASSNDLPMDNGEVILPPGLFEEIDESFRKLSESMSK
jgi:hypothetical protein